MLNGKTVEKLRAVDTSALVSYLGRELRDRTTADDYNLFAISICFLALEYDEDSKADIRKKITDCFKSETPIHYLAKLIKQEFELIQTLSARFDKDVLKAAILFWDYQQLKSRPENETHVGLSRLAISLLKLESDDVLLDLGSGIGSFLTEAAFRHDLRALYGVEIQTGNIITSSIVSAVYGVEIEYIQGNIISQDYRSLEATKVFSHFPLGMKMIGIEDYIVQFPFLKTVFENVKRTVSADWAFAMAAYHATKPGGKCICIMSNSGTWNQADEELRRSMIEKGQIEGVISLPRNLLSSTGIPVTMVIFSENNQSITMVDATDIYTKGRRQNTLGADDIAQIVHAYEGVTELSKTISLDECRDNEYVLNPMRYIGSESHFKNVWTFDEIALSINRGAMIGSTELDTLVTSEKTPYRYLMLQNISDNIIDDSLTMLSMISEKHEKYCVDDGDLIISKNSPFKIAQAHFEDGLRVLASGNLYVVKMDEKLVNPLYIEAFLQSEAGMAQLSRLSKGSTTGSISIQDLRIVKIPKVSLEQQSIIANKYEELKEHQAILELQMEEIKEKKSRLFEGV